MCNELRTVARRSECRPWNRYLGIADDIEPYEPRYPVPDVQSERAAFGPLQGAEVEERT